MNSMKLFLYYSLDLFHLILCYPVIVGDQAVVRDKATRALHSLLLRAPELLPSQLETVEAALLDRDPIVMTSAIQLCLTFAAVRSGLPVIQCRGGEATWTEASAKAGVGRNQGPSQALVAIGNWYFLPSKEK